MEESINIDIYTRTVITSGGKTKLTDERCLLGGIIAHQYADDSKVLIYDGEELIDTIYAREFKTCADGDKPLGIIIENSLSICSYPADVFTVYYI